MLAAGTWGYVLRSCPLAEPRTGNSGLVVFAGGHSDVLAADVRIGHVEAREPARAETDSVHRALDAATPLGHEQPSRDKKVRRMSLRD